eukprot:comp23694_c6_seq1/m.40692 comp23694_c6_seq1/g.40692  ORF comp23694_c6_seq1/g.40692 comp23694_c6_seq1/m.40692 type:complete len:430 (-) comp23694_c6_seq1:425-1714(-)
MAEDAMFRVPKKVTVQVFDAKVKAKHGCYVTMACGSSKFKTAEVKPSGEKLTWNEEAQLQVGSSATEVVLKIKEKSGSFGGGSTIGTLYFPLKDLSNAKGSKKYRDLDKGGQLSCVVWVSESEEAKESTLSRKKSFLSIKGGSSMRKTSASDVSSKDANAASGNAISTSAVSTNGASAVAVSSTVSNNENTAKTDASNPHNEKSNTSIPGTVGPAVVTVRSPGGSDVHAKNNTSISSLTKSMSKAAAAPIKFVASPVVAAGGVIKHGAQSLTVKLSSNNASQSGLSTNSNDTLTFAPCDIPLAHAVEAAISYAKEKEPELATRPPFVEGSQYVQRHDSLASLDDNAAGQATSIADENFPSDMTAQASDMPDGPTEPVDDVPIEDLERELEARQERNKELVTKRDKLKAYMEDLHWRLKETGNEKLIPAF